MTENELQKRLSTNLKALRKINALSQEKLAEKAQISVQMMNDIEGCRRWPSVNTLTKLANALETDVSVLFSHESSEQGINIIQKRKISEEIKNQISLTIDNYFSESK